MLVRSSHLSLRFYVRDGWVSKGTVTTYVDGKVIKRGSKHKPVDPVYFIPAVGSKINAELLIRHGHIICNYHNIELNSEDGRRYAEGMSW